jgi:hypothetical protein
MSEIGPGLRLRNTTGRPVELHLANRVVVIPGHQEAPCTAEELALGAVDVLLRRGTLHVITAPPKEATVRSAARPRAKRQTTKCTARPTKATKGHPKPAAKPAAATSNGPAPTGRRASRPSP